jgi:sarcosine oxidase subunit gamma
VSAQPAAATATTGPQRRSPLGATTTAPLQLASAPGIDISELPFTTQLNLRLTPDPAGLAAIVGAIGVAIPTTPNRVETVRDLRVIWLGPDEWLIVGPAAVSGPDGHVPVADARGAAKSSGDARRGVRVGGAGALTAVAVGAAISRAGGSVVDVSAQRTILRLSGSRASEMLAHGCSIDLHPRAFEVGACAQTMLARVDVILERRSAEEYEVFVRTSFASYLVDWLREEMGVRTTAARPQRVAAGRASPAAAH